MSKSYAVPNIISIYPGFATPDGVLSVPISSNRSFQLHGFCVSLIWTSNQKLPYNLPDTALLSIFIQSSDELGVW